MSEIKTTGFRSLFSTVFKKIGTFMNICATLIEKPKINAESKKWFNDNGDKTYRLFYEELNESSLVFDLGGYEGQWTSDIYSMYRCKIHIFEPVITFAEKIGNRFLKNSDVIVHQFGLSNKNEILKIGIDNDSTSIFKNGRELAEAKLIEADQFLKENKIGRIDLMKINIEGSEYDLLEHLINTGYVKNIKNIQVQFHSFVPNAEERMLNLQNKLKITHQLTYQYRFVWENWRLKE
jgi:FkbM family methyltransferase